MRDGLYRVETSYLCAGFVVRGGRVTWCAPILWRRIEYWKRSATRVGDTLVGSKWRREKSSGASVAALGHGLRLRVVPEGDKFLVYVFGQQLVTPAKSRTEGKRRAVTVAYSWLSEARLRMPPTAM